jgi:hypothetical protein
MFILGLLAFLQTTFFPGFLLLKYTKTRINKIRQLVYGFGLSLLINYLLVFLLTITGIYRPLTLYIILFIEGVLLVYYYWKHRLPGYIKLDFPQYFVSMKRFTASHSLVYNFLFIVSLAIILWYVFLFFYFLGGVFEHWDPVVGWNRFALDWADNQLPGHTWRYPQLIPANWSISYVLLQNTDVQCFAKALMPLFSLGVLLLFLDLGLRIQKKKSFFLLGLILFGIFLAYMYNPSFIVSGYVDIAVSFFAFLAFHALRRFPEENNRGNFRQVWWAVVFASAAAVTKQSGLFFLAVVLVWAFIRIFKNRKAFSPKKTVGIILLVLLTVSIVSVSWYVLKEIHIQRGKDQSGIELVQMAHHGAGYMQRFTGAVTKLATHRHPKLKFLFYAGILVMLLGVFHKKSRRVTLIIVIPYTMIWGFFFSYDSRNLAPVIPFMAIAAAGGIVFLKKLFPGEKKMPVFTVPVIPVIILVLLGLAVMNFTLLEKDTIIRQQIHKKMEMGDAELNALLYSFHKKQGITGKIATNYLYLKYLPGLEQFFLYRPGRVSSEFLEYLETPGGKEIHFLLVPKILEIETDVYQRYQEKLKSGKYRQVFRYRGYQFIKISRK